MLNPKPLSVFIIISILLIGLYEQHTGNVVSVSQHWSRRADTGHHYKMVSGNALVYFSLFLAAIASYLFRKD